MKTLSTRAQTQDNLRRLRSHWPGVRGRVGGLHSPRGRGRRGPRLPVDATPFLAYAFHSPFPSPGGGGGGGGAHGLSGDSQKLGRGSREEWRRSAVAYLLGPGAAAAAAPGERQVAFQLRAALGVRNDHGVLQVPPRLAEGQCTPGGFGRMHAGSRDWGRWGGSRARASLGVPERSESLESGHGRCCAGLSFPPASGAVNALGSPGLVAAQGFSRPGVPLESAVAGAACRPSAPQHPRRGTASARRALTPAAPLSRLRSLGEGGDTKAPRRSQSDACFPGRRGPHLPLEPTAGPIGTRKRPGTLGAVVSLGRMLQTFAKGFSQIVGNTRRE